MIVSEDRRRPDTSDVGSTDDVELFWPPIFDSVRIRSAFLGKIEHITGIEEAMRKRPGKGWDLGAFVPSVL